MAQSFGALQGQGEIEVTKLSTPARHWCDISLYRRDSSAGLERCRECHPSSRIGLVKICTASALRECSLTSQTLDTYFTLNAQHWICRTGKALGGRLKGCDENPDCVNFWRHPRSR